MDPIVPHDTLPSLMADPATVQAALDLLHALERLELVITVDQRIYRGVIDFSGQNATLAVKIDT